MFLQIITAAAGVFAMVTLYWLARTASWRSDTASELIFQAEMAADAAVLAVKQGGNSAKADVATKWDAIMSAIDEAAEREPQLAQEVHEQLEERGRITHSHRVSLQACLATAKACPQA